MLIAMATRAHAASIGAGVLAAAFATGCGPANESPCEVGEEVYASGEAFTSPDGCLHYVCEDGEVVIDASDERVETGSVRAATQAEMDALACIVEVGGALEITGSVADLGALGYLRSVGAGLTVQGSAVTSLDLVALGQVSGPLVVADNASLTALRFSTSMSLYGDFTLQNNDALTSLAGAEFLAGCSSCLAPPPPTGTWRDADPSGFGAPENPGGIFHGNLLVADNDVLTDLTAISTLTLAWADFRLRANAALSSLSALTLTEVAGSLEITDHPELVAADVAAFVAGIQVGGTLLTCGNGDDIECE